MKKQQGIKAALEEYAGAARSLEYQTGMYKALPQTIAERESDLSTCAAELAEVKGTLTKPWDEYTAHWEGSRRVPLHIGARRAYDLTNRQEYIKNDITELKRFAAQSLRKHTENERKVKEGNCEDLLREFVRTSVYFESRVFFIGIPVLASEQTYDTFE